MGGFYHGRIDANLKTPGRDTLCVRFPPALNNIGVYREKTVYSRGIWHTERRFGIVFNMIETQRIFKNPIVDDYLLTWVEEFLIDSEAHGESHGTLRFYQ